MTVSSYGDWESLRIVRNELNLNPYDGMASLAEGRVGARSSVVASARNPFRAEMLPDNQPLFGVLPPAAHLPALEQTVGFAGVVCALRRCGASLTNQSIASVFQTIAVLRKARPSAHDSNIGNTKTQNSASGSRKNSRSLVSVNSMSG